MIVLIPSYRPDERLVHLVEVLRAGNIAVLVIDDGSGATYDVLFSRVAALGAETLRMDHNRGKGAALKAGIAHVRRRDLHCAVVTADGDGQHRPEDILRVMEATAREGTLVLGGRAFRGAVPLRSRVGNAAARLLFRLAGVRGFGDTQTGLRGIPADLLDVVLAVEGERFEWEMNVLLALVRRGTRIVEIEIATVYLDDNASSHFRPLRDSARVLTPLLRYVAVSLGSFLLDLAVLQGLVLLGWPLLVAVTVARVASGTANFLLNRTVVFRAVEGSVARQALRYVLVALAMLAGSAIGVLVLTGWGMPVVVAKIIADSAVYIAGFVLQRGFVFLRHDARETERREVEALVSR